MVCDGRAPTGIEDETERSCQPRRRRVLHGDKAPATVGIKKPPCENIRFRPFPLRGRGHCARREARRIRRRLASPARRCRRRARHVLEPRQRRVLAEDVGRPARGEGAAVAEPPATSRPAANPARLARRAAKGRWREITRSEFVTVPSFSPHAAAGRLRSRRRAGRRHGR